MATTPVRFWVTRSAAVRIRASSPADRVLRRPRRSPGLAPRRLRALDDRPRRARGRSTRARRCAMPGVVAVYTADDLDLADHHGFMMLPPTMNRPPLARDRVRYVGDIVAVVVAETKAQAVDAAEAVIVDYDPLPAVVDPRGRDRARRARGVRGAGFEHRQRHGHRPGRGRARRRRHHRERRASSTSASRRCRWSRPASSSTPGEPEGGLTFWAATQGPHGVRDELAAKLGLDPAQVHGVNAAVGGGFGAKAGFIVEYQIVGQGRVAARPPGEVDGDALREHGRDVARPRPRALRRDGAEARRHDHRLARAHAGRRRRVPARSARSCRSSRR